MGRETARQVAATLALGLACASCGTLRDGTHWGENVTIVPDGERWARAAREAAADPLTWVPLAGAAVFMIDDLDEQCSDWAIEHTPIFGSNADANDATDDLRDVARTAWWVSGLAAPSGNELEEWAINKVQGFAAEFATVWIVDGLTYEIKDWTDRERPTGGDDDSFPSSAASSTAAYTALTWRNLEQAPMPDGLRLPLRGTLIALEYVTAWSRIEAGAHYPTDVLVGLSLGNFLANFFYDALFDNTYARRFGAYVSPADGSFAVSWTFSN